jgi:zinc/manganese transport system substrate-binding protein/manganese/iron transport system substrate-binding protein
MVSRRVGVGLVAGLLAISITGCGPGGASGGGGGESVQVAATISVLQDLVEQVGGDRVEVFSIVPVGGSPETFQPSPRDAGRISESQVVFENGLGLDAWVEDLIESAGNEEQTVVELSEGLEPIEGGEHEEEHGAEEHAHEHGEGNPHLWLDVANAEHYVERIRDTLVEVDPEGAEEYEANAEEYLAELEELDGYIRERAEGIPEERRKLVTFHDAFPYFADAYGFELVGVVLENPESEPGSREVAEVVRTIEEEEVPVVFTEPQFNAGLADTIAQEAGVEVRELYTDTLVDDEAGDTYEAMMRTNIDRISEALG